MEQCVLEKRLCDDRYAAVFYWECDNFFVKHLSRRWSWELDRDQTSIGT